VTAVDWLTVISLLLAVSALVLAGQHLREGTRHTSRLEFVANSLSTRYVGQFPDYLEDAVTVLESARCQIRILVWMPGPAFFSQPTTFVRYNQAIERKARDPGVNVQLICLNGRLRHERLTIQFQQGSEDEWSLWREENASRLEIFLRQDDDLVPQHIAFGTFVERNAFHQSQVLDYLRRCGVTTIEVDQNITVQAWIADDTQAIFSIHSSTSRSSYGLYTSDPRLVAALISMTEHYSTLRSGPATSPT
jgi:hypothetical protein